MKCLLLIVSLIVVCIDGTEYFIGSNMGTYTDGINTCIDEGGILATITNLMRMNIILQRNYVLIIVFIVGLD